MKYLLDTNICIYFLRQNTKIIEKITSVSIDDLSMSYVNLAELLFGAYNSDHVDSNIKRVHYIENIIKIIPFDRKSAENFAMIKAELKKQKNLIDDFDILIAAIALSYDLILVTNNEKHFKRIPKLKIENWLI